MKTGEIKPDAWLFHYDISECAASGDKKELASKHAFNGLFNGKNIEGHNCAECSKENEIVAEDFADWTCNGCGYEPDWSDHGNGKDEVYRCLWCARPDTIVTFCESCTREAQERDQLRRAQCCPYCDEKISANDLRKINQARREVKEKLPGVREKGEEDV